MPSETSCPTLPPGPGQLAELGIDRATLELLRDAALEYGPVVRFVTGSGKPAVFVEDPELAQTLLVRRHTQSSKGKGFERVKMLLGNGLIVSDGEHWRRSRTMVQPAFKPRNIERMAGCMLEHAAHMAEVWSAAADADEPLELAEQTTRFGLGVIVQCMFGQDVDAFAAAEPGSAFAFLRPDAARDLSMVQAARALRGRIEGVVQKRRAEQRDDDDFLGLYLNARDKGGSPFSDSELLDEMITLLVAGFETTANTLAWVWYELAQHPAVARRVHEEVLNAHAYPATTLESVSDLPYTLQVIQETLRLYPPVWLYTRRADCDLQLGDYRIEQGAQIYLSPYLTQRSDRYWSEPERFQPERFEGIGQSAQGAAFYPFSLGPRRCVGEHFSYLEMKIQLAQLLPRFEPHPLQEGAPDCEFAINLRASDPIHIKLTQRREI